MVGAEEFKSPSIAELQATADHGDAAAQYQLARAYLRGVDVPKDPKKAFELMKAAADQGNADAIGTLGYFYSAGIVVPKDEKQALDWFQQGAEKGSARAQLNLGKYLLNGKGDANADVEITRKTGLQWMQKAADQKLPEASLAHGSVYYFGDHGVSQDYQAAAPYLKFAAEQGLPEAQNFMGIIENQGLIGPENQILAEQWFRQAALQGNVKAQSNLGRVLGPSSEVQETQIEALAWLLIASDQNEVTAKKELQGALPGLEGGEMETASKKAVELRKLIQPKMR